MKVITVAAAIIINQYQQLLVVRKKNTAYFMQVGGKLEPHEDPEQTICRETLEEIATPVQIKQFIGRFETAAANEANHQLISYVYWVELAQPPKIAAEIAEMRWIDVDDQDTPLAPLTQQVVLPWVKQHLLSRCSS